MSKRNRQNAELLTVEDIGPQKQLKTSKEESANIENNGVSILPTPNGNKASVLKEDFRNGKSGEQEWTVTRGPQIIQMGSKSCAHEVAWPGIVTEESAFQAPSKSKNLPAKTYPFPVDPFQQVAINCLEAGKLYKLSNNSLTCSYTPWVKQFVGVHSPESLQTSLNCTRDQVAFTLNGSQKSTEKHKTNKRKRKG